MIRFPRISWSATAVALLVFLLSPAALHAQYMYLDTTGDGKNTGADCLSTSGPTTVDVYLDANRNKDGSPSACSGNWNSYTFILRAVGGRVSWTNPQDRVGFSSISPPEVSDPLVHETDFHAGAATNVPLPFDGTPQHLYTVTVAVVSGNPHLEFATTTLLSPHFYTSFGSDCLGKRFDNTLRLGLDWCDTGGTYFPCAQGPGSVCIQDYPGMAMWLTFDEPDDNPSDIATGVNNGDFTLGASPIAGKVGKGAVSLNDQYVRVEHSPELNIGTEFSYTVWVQLHSPIQTGPRTLYRQILATKGLGQGSGSVPGPGYDFNIEPGGTEFRVRLSDGTVLRTFTFPICTFDNGWHHVAVVIARGDPSCSVVPRGVSLYVDGGLVATRPPQNIPPGSFVNELPFFIGNNLPHFSGDIDEAIVFQRALTQDEVTEISKPAGFLSNCDARPSLGPPPGEVCTVPPRMVAWWTFDDADAGDDAGGISANWGHVAHDGDFTLGASPIAGKVGKGAVSLNDQYVRVEHSPELNIGTEFSYTVWVQLHSPIQTGPRTLYRQILATKGLGQGSGSVPGPGYDFNIEPGGTEFRVRLSDGTVLRTFTFPICTFDNGWHHVAVVIARGDPSCSVVPRGVSLYVDGGLVATRPPQNIPPGSFVNELPFFIGNNLPHFSGDIDEAIVFQRALTQDEVTEISKPAGFLSNCDARPSLGPPPGEVCTVPPRMVAWWTFDDADAGDDAGGISANWGHVAHDGDFTLGASPIAGKVGKGAVSLNDQYVRVEHSPELNIGTEFSYTVWVQLHSPIQTGPRTLYRQILATKGLGQGSGSVPGPGYDFNIEPGGTEFRVRLSDGTVLRTFTFPICTFDNGWHHVAVVIARGDPSCSVVPRGVSLYVDGGLVATRPPQNIPPGSFVNELPFFIGNNLPHFSGDIDEAIVFQRALTQDEVTEISKPAGFLSNCDARPSLGPPPGEVCTVPPRMVAWWTFDDADAGDDAGGISANWGHVAHDGDFTLGASPIAGKVGKGAVSLNDQYVRVEHSPELNIGTEFSYTVWVQLHSPIQTGPRTLYRQILATKGLGQGSGSVPGPGYDFNIEPGGTEFRVRLSDGTVLRTFTFPICTFDNGWHHVAVVIARGDPSCSVVPRGVSLYVDGGLVATRPPQNIPPGSFVNELPFFIGNNLPHFSGDIDEAIVFQRALTQDEVTEISKPAGFLSNCDARPLHGETAPSAPPCVLLVSGPGTESAAIALKSAAGEAFTTSPSRTIQLRSTRPSWCAQIQPNQGSLSLSDVISSSAVLISQGTGTVNQISAISDKSVVLEDQGADLTSGASLCFRQADLRALFSNITGITHLPVAIEVTLVGGVKIRAPLTVEVVGSGEALTASFSSNLLNSGGTLTFRTWKAGPVQARLFDANGRLVRTLLARTELPAGYHDLRFDGFGNHGNRLASGVYFYVVEARGESVSGRLVIVK